MQYTVDYFIKKFEAIPEDKWLTRSYEDPFSGKKCALGHCGLTFSEESKQKFGSAYGEEFAALQIIFDGKAGGVDGGRVAKINDGIDDNYNQPTAKQRILAALYDIKKMQEPKVKEVIKYVAVPTTISEQAAETVLN